MIFLSAQPDQTYFIWQLEIQLRNLYNLGVPKEQIQVLASYQDEVGLNPNFQKFMDGSSHLANFYIYTDLRKNPKYTSSIRPNILKQHFDKYPNLEKETLFYHDSDILFSRIPQIQEVETNDICYVSDTRNYLDMEYIRRTGSEQLLADMANVVGIPVATIAKHDKHTGGAQYILKNIDSGFWEKVERDSEALFVLMKDYNTKLWEQNYPSSKGYRSKKRGIQAWCADMWAVLWNLWLTDKNVEIHPEMDFSWPYSPIEEWDTKAIQHYSGNIEDKTKYFKKNEYLNYTPWYDDELKTIPNTNCSSKIVALIHQRKEELDAKRTCLPLTCIIIDGKGYKQEQIESAHIIKKHIEKYLDVAVYVLKDDPIKLPHEYNTIDLIDMINMAGLYDRVLSIPLGYIVASEVIERFLNSSNDYEEILFIPKGVYIVDQLFVETFSKVLDIELLHLNKGKFNTKSVSCESYLSYTKLSGSVPQRKKQLTDLLKNPTNHLAQKMVIDECYYLLPLQ